MKQYLKLLMAREGKEVLGKNGSNLWILTIVLIATFLSIAFSEGSRIYLKYKMVDPFTNWVSIKNSTDSEQFAKFKKALEDNDNKLRFGYSNVQVDQTTNWNMEGVNDGLHGYYLSLRSFEDIESNIVKAILEKENVVGGACIDSSFLKNNSLGIILSLDAAKLLGYSEAHLPTYICHMAHTEGADSLGIQVSESGYVRIPLPVLAVVKKLPENVDMVIGSFLYSQRENNVETLPFNFVQNEKEYLHSLRYFVADEVGEKLFQETINAVLPDSLRDCFNIYEDLETENMRPWRSGSMRLVSFGNKRLSRKTYQDIANEIEKKFDTELVARVYKYNVLKRPYTKGTFISVEFKDQSHIRDFEQFAKGYTVQLEMSKVASMENFNAVTVIARILSAAMVVFSIVCIIMFLVNMLQNYFQKVKRNLGTFKAFGMNTRELTLVYIIILISIVFVAVIMALMVTWAIQGLLPFVGIEKDGFNYLSLWNVTTYIASAVVLFSTILTVIIVMTRMLSQTPGDLIYDRN